MERAICALLTAVRSEHGCTSDRLASHRALSATARYAAATIALYERWTNWTGTAQIMAVMLGNLYRALIMAGAPDSEAQKAAEEVAGFESRLAGIESKMSLLQWMVGFNLALSVGIALKLLAP